MRILKNTESYTDLLFNVKEVKIDARALRASNDLINDAEVSTQVLDACMALANKHGVEAASYPKIICFIAQYKNVYILRIQKVQDISEVRCPVNHERFIGDFEKYTHKIEKGEIKVRGINDKFILASTSMEYLKECIKYIDTAYKSSLYKYGNTYMLVVKPKALGNKRNMLAEFVEINSCTKDTEVWLNEYAVCLSEGNALEVISKYY